MRDYLPITRFGSQVTSGGKNVIRPSTTSRGIRNGAVQRDDLLEGEAADLDHDEEDDAEGGRQEADHQVQHHDDAEVDRVDADLGHDLHQDGAEDQDGHDGLEEAADDEQEEIDDEQERRSGCC